MNSKINIDYTELYAKRLRENNKFFAEQKKLIESQLKSSKSLFSNMFKTNFKKNARDYLKQRGLI